MEQRRQAMLQLHLSDQQFYCILRGDLYKRFYDNQYRDCWGPDDARTQGISNHSIDLVLQVSLIYSNRIHLCDGKFSLTVLSIRSIAETNWTAKPSTATIVNVLSHWLTLASSQPMRDGGTCVIHHKTYIWVILHLFPLLPFRFSVQALELVVR